MTKIVGPSGVVIDVAEDMAACLVDAGHARYISEPVIETVPKVTENIEEIATAVEESSSESTSAETAAETVVDTVPVDAPRGNASREEFAEYATKLGIEFAEDATRDEIRALVASKG